MYLLYQHWWSLLHTFTPPLLKITKKVFAAVVVLRGSGGGRVGVSSRWRDGVPKGGRDHVIHVCFEVGSTHAPHFFFTFS